MAKKKTLGEQIKERFEEAQEQKGWPDSYQKIKENDKYKETQVDKETEDFLNGRGEFS